MFGGKQVVVCGYGEVKLIQTGTYTFSFYRDHRFLSEFKTMMLSLNERQLDFK